MKIAGSIKKKKTYKNMLLTCIRSNEKMTNLQAAYAVRISILCACCNLSMQIVKEYFD